MNTSENQNTQDNPWLKGYPSTKDALIDKQHEMRKRVKMRVFTSADEVLSIIPTGLERETSFVLFAMKENRRTGKHDKVPVDAHGHECDAHDAKNHMGVRDAASLIVASKGMMGLAIVLREDRPFFCVDLDNAFDLKTNTWSQLSIDVYGMLPGAATEVSLSGRGLHIFGSGSFALPASRYYTKRKGLPGLEFYTSKRMICLTGTHKQGSAIVDFTGMLPAFIERYGLEKNEFAEFHAPIDGQPDPAYTGAWSDDELIHKMITSKGGVAALFGDGCHVRDLWYGRHDELAKHYPATERGDGLSFDHSAVDFALLWHLAFWTGRDFPRMERLFTQSALGQRGKWRNRAYYRRVSIVEAAKRQPKIYDREARRSENAEIGNDTGDDLKPCIMTIDDMVRDLVYVEKTEEVVHRVTCRPRSWSAAIGAYAASVYDIPNPLKPHEPPKQAPCLPAWRRREDRITADVVTWSPKDGEFCAPPDVTNGNSRGYNTWKGLRPLACPPDWQQQVKPFITHIEYLMRVTEERDRFVQWLGHIVQHPGELPHTAYLMVTRQTGIGRNLLASMLVRVLRGYVAASVPLDNILAGGKNGMLSQKLLAIVDEVKQGNSEHRWERGERLKKIITETDRDIDEKYGKQRTEFNCCRWLMFSNHYDALPFENNDRRVIVIENPMERKPPDYYAKVYKLVDDPGFIGSVRKYLETVDLRGFNPGDIAPMNAAKTTALAAMTSPVDLAVDEFRKTWKGEIAGRNFIRRYVEQSTGTNVNTNHFTHALQRAGIISWGCRFNTIGGGRDHVVIVRTVTKEQVEAADRHYIAKYIDDFEREFDK